MRPVRPARAQRYAGALAALTAAVVLSIGASARSSATVVVAKDFTALCAEADLVFVGTVTGVES
ncbi:MAG: hypothetical protein AB7P78_13320, partial [Candidatus Binatia bacterium]